MSPLGLDIPRVLQCPSQIEPWTGYVLPNLRPHAHEGEASKLQGVRMREVISQTQKGCIGVHWRLGLPGPRKTWKTFQRKPPKAHPTPALDMDKGGRLGQTLETWSQRFVERGLGSAHGFAPAISINPELEPFLLKPTKTLARKLHHG